MRFIGCWGGLTRAVGSTAFLVLVAACGGGGGGSGDGGSTSGGAGTTPPVAVTTHSASGQVSHAEPLADGKVALAVQLNGFSPAPEELVTEMASVGLLVWDPTTRTLTAAARLSLPRADLDTYLGTASLQRPFAYNVTDMRALPDGGLVVQADLFGPASVATTDEGKLHLIARLDASLKVQWAHVWRTQQPGRLEVRSDGLLDSAGMRYRFDGTVESTSLLGSTSAELQGGRTVYGVFGTAVILRDSAGTSEARPWPAYFVTSTRDGRGGALLGGRSLGDQPVLAQVDDQGAITRGIQLDVQSGGAGLRDIVVTAGAVYAVGSRKNNAGGSDWLVCKFSAALALVRCVGGTGGNSGSNINLRANAQGTQLFLSRAIAALNPLVIFDSDLRVVAAHGATVSDLAITASSLELPPVGATLPVSGLDVASRKLAVPVSLETVAPGAIEASGLGPMLR